MATDTPRQVTDLTSRYVEDNVQLWRQYADGLRRVSEGVFSAAAPGRPAGLSTPDLAGRARDFVHLSVTHYSKLLTTYADFVSHFLTTMLPPSRPASPPSEPGLGPSASTPGAGDVPIANLELTFSGAPGDSVQQSFVVANRKAAEVEVGFELTEFVSEDGARRFRAPVLFTPDRFVLPAGAEAVVECRIAIDPLFLPGTRYLSLLRISGFPEIRTALVVVPTGSPAAPSPDATPPKRATALRRPTARPRKTARRT